MSLRDIAERIQDENLSKELVRVANEVEEVKNWLWTLLDEWYLLKDNQSSIAVFAEINSIVEKLEVIENDIWRKHVPSDKALQDLKGGW